MDGSLHIFVQGPEISGGRGQEGRVFKIKGEGNCLEPPWAQSSLRAEFNHRPPSPLSH